ncbi:pseudouridine synthase [Tricharina praecox]|uniref:pseudouridine synthase n=1 Tax=Tricharina praecox TaxID=43433 RepID=UPI00221EF867|nr:pseudouridine synthase [Tricharina praecox]XP_051344488.1 pseudouridine synthase [Tricharina praecox]KAI5840627.1 pseudouridine synthase [Tricharina praecox]KAI5858888.1 pseudouridine synthase [Tricharina praecox]
MDIDGQEEGEPAPFDDIADEMPYTAILNRLLPPTIRILAWAPNPPAGFSARFNCRARHYRYFFTNPMLSPTNPGGALDIAAMQTAAQYFLGSRDFRNFCKLDPAKQIDNFSRDILEASIEELPSSSGDVTSAKTYYFNLKGTAFLWHQVRHMMAVLFLVGQGLEKPEIVRDMLDIARFPTKPMYEMAEDRPLVLWDCVFPNDDLRWLVADDGDLRGALADTTWMGWHEKKIDEVLAGQLVGLVRRQREESEMSPVLQRKKRKAAKPGHVLVLGSGEAVLRGKYVPMKDRKKMRPVAEINKSFIERKGDWRERRELKRKKDEEEEEEASE